MRRDEALLRIKMRIAGRMAGWPTARRAFDEAEAIRERTSWTWLEVVRAVRPLPALALLALMTTGLWLVLVPDDALTTCGEVVAVSGALVLVVRHRGGRSITPFDIAFLGWTAAAGLGVGFITVPPFSETPFDAAFLAVDALLLSAGAVAVVAGARGSITLAARSRQLLAIAASGLAVTDILYRPAGRGGAFIAASVSITLVVVVLTTAPIELRTSSALEIPTTQGHVPAPSTWRVLVDAAGGPDPVSRALFLTSLMLFCVVAVLHVHVGLVRDAVGNLLTALVALGAAVVFHSQRRSLQVALLVAVGFGALAWATSLIGWAELPALARYVTFVAGFGSAGMGSLVWAYGLRHESRSCGRLGRVILAVGLTVVTLATVWDGVIQVLQHDAVRVLAVAGGAVAMITLQAGMLALGLREADPAPDSVLA